MITLYSGFFLMLPILGNVHVTWEFNPGKCTLPKSTFEGREVLVHVVGDYKDEDLSCLIVEVELPDGKVLTHQASGTVLHITTHVEPGVSPVQSGVRATAQGWEHRKNNSLKFVTHVAKAGFFRVE